MLKQQGVSKPFALSKDRQQEILRKLDGSVHTEAEYKKILVSLEQQNVRLREQLKIVGDKVIKLLEKKKIQKPENTHAIESQIIQAKAQLEARYKQFDQFKQEIQVSRNRIQDIMLNEKFMQFSSDIKQVDRDLKALKEEKKLLETNTKELSSALDDYNKERMPDKDKIEYLIKENKELKRKALNERKKDDKIDQEAIKVQQSLVSLQMKVRRAQKPDVVPKSLRSLKTIIYDKSDILNDSLANEVDTLKTKKNNLIDQQQKRKAQLSNSRAQLYSTNQTLWQRSKKLQTEKIKLFQEYNKYEAFILEQSHNKKKLPKQLPKENSTQTEQIQHLYRLRRDYAGIIGKVRFDDRISVLKSNFSCKIFRINVFENEKGIAAVKFSYYNSENMEEIFEGVTPVPISYLQKCKKRTFEVQSPDFFKLFKVKTNTIQKRITKFEIIANSSQKSEFGQKKPFEIFDRDDAVYGFDINIQEHPASMFGSVQQVGQQWYLESLGAEIKDAKEKMELQQIEQINKL